MYWAFSLLFELINEAMVLYGIFRIKPANKRRVIIALSVFIICEIIILLINVPKSENDFVLFITAVSFTVCFIPLTGKRKILNIMLAFIITIFLSALLLGFLTLLTGLRPDEVGDITFYNVVANSLTIVILCIATIISNRLYFEKAFQKLKIKHYIVFMFGIFSCAVQLVSLQAIVSADTYGNRYKNVSLVGINISGIIFVLVCAGYVISDILKKKYMEISEINKKLLEQKEKNYELLIEKNNEILKIQHEFNHHISSINFLLDAGRIDELKEYLAKIKKNPVMPKLEIDTGNDLIDAIINDLHGKYSDTKIVCENAVPEKLNIPHPDICAIFYNLFENAFEAIEKLPSSQEKVITMSVNYLMQSLIIKIKNPIAERITFKNNKPKTTKKDKRFHGYGISNISEAVCRNCGNITFDCTESEFTAALIFENIEL